MGPRGLAVPRDCTVASGCDLSPRTWGTFPQRPAGVAVDLRMGPAACLSTRDQDRETEQGAAKPSFLVERRWRLAGEAGATKPREPPSELQKPRPAGWARARETCAALCLLCSAAVPGGARCPAVLAPPVQPPAPWGLGPSLLLTRWRPHFPLPHSRPPGRVASACRAKGAGLGAKQTPSVSPR